MTISTEIGYTTPDIITVRGHDLARDLMGTIDFVDMIVLATTGQVPQPAQKAMLNAILVAVTDHGLTPSAMSARLTYLGAPESLQGAVAAGLLGAGSVFLGAMENATQMLADAVREVVGSEGDDPIAATAMRVVVARRAQRKPLFGFGHNIHVDADPRVKKLAALARENGCFGEHWSMLEAIDAAQRSVRPRALPINAAGAIAASLADLRLPAALARGLALIGRCAGLVAHLIEETERPIGAELWHLVLQQDSRNSLAQR